MDNKEGKKKKHIVLKVLLALLVLIVLFIVINGVKNGKIMNNTIAAGIEELSKEYKVTEIDAGEYEKLKIYGIMKFNTKCYEVEGLGHLCVMTTNMGLMQMSSFIMSPFEKDMPEMCLDFVYMFGVRKGYVEFYNLAVDEENETYKAVLSALEKTTDEFDYMTDCKPEVKWYDEYLVSSTFRSTSSKEESEFNDLFVKPVATYARESKKMQNLSGDDVKLKKSLIKDYSDKLIDMGGVSTDIFKKALGEDKTRSFFDYAFYGTGR